MKLGKLLGTNVFFGVIGGDQFKGRGTGEESGQLVIGTNRPKKWGGGRFPPINRHHFPFLPILEITFPIEILSLSPNFDRGGVGGLR